MLEIVLWGLLAVAVAGGLCALAVVFLPAGEQIAPPLRDEPIWSLPPDRGLLAEDVDTVRLPVALRGYRFAETDQLLDRLAEEIRTRDLELARLRQKAPAYGYASMPDAPAESPVGADPEATDERVAGEQSVGESDRAYRPDSSPFARPATPASTDPDGGDGPT